MKKEQYLHVMLDRRYLLQQSIHSTMAKLGKLNNWLSPPPPPTRQSSITLSSHRAICVYLGDSVCDVPLIAHIIIISNLCPLSRHCEGFLPVLSRLSAAYSEYGLSIPDSEAGEADFPKSVSASYLTSYCLIRIFWQ